MNQLALVTVRISTGTSFHAPSHSSTNGNNRGSNIHHVLLFVFVVANKKLQGPVPMVSSVLQIHRKTWFLTCSQFNQESGMIRKWDSGNGVGLGELDSVFDSLSSTRISQRQVTERVDPSWEGTKETETHLVTLAVAKPEESKSAVWNTQCL